jgi:hypothetical protein
VVVIAVITGVFALCALTWIIAYYPLERPWIFNDQYPMIGFDLISRIFEVNEARLGHNIYSSFGADGFTYPPAAIFLFLPSTYLPIREAFAAWTGLSIVCLAATYLVLLRATKTGSWLEHIAISMWACVATVVIFSPMDDMLAFGQTSTIVLLLVVLDVLIVRDRSQGFLVGLAMAFKLYPGVVVFFWLGRRQWRAAVTALATFIGLTVCAWAVWPQSSPWSYAKILFGSSARTLIEQPGYMNRNASVTGFFLRLPFISHSSALVLGTVASVVIAIVGIWVAVRLDRKDFRVTSLVILLCTSTVISPLAWDHYFTFAPMLVFVIMEVGFSRPEGKLAALALACFAFPRVPYYWGVAHPNFGDDVRSLISFNALFVGSMLVMVSGVLAANRQLPTRHDQRSLGSAGQLQLSGSSHWAEAPKLGSASADN